ncbi:MAG: hypothetical protein AAF604_01440 [Acidobacteriota bacterium]
MGKQGDTSVKWKDYEDRYYGYSSLVGKSAVIAKIRKASGIYLANDHEKSLFELVEEEMETKSPPAGWTVDQILQGCQFEKDVKESYNRHQRATSGKTDTQLGLRADHANYRS